MKAVGRRWTYHMRFIEDGRYRVGRHAGRDALEVGWDRMFVYWALASREMLDLSFDDVALLEASLNITFAPPPLPVSVPPLLPDQSATPSVQPPPLPLPVTAHQVEELSTVDETLDEEENEVQEPPVYVPDFVPDAEPESEFTLLRSERVSSSVFQWNKGQLDALEFINNWMLSDRAFAGLCGAAGTGKSTLVSELVERYPLNLTAMTGKAALRLGETSGRSASTLHRLMYWPPTHDDGGGMRFTRLREPPYGVVLIDEASMMTPQVFNDLRRWGVRFILVGDPFQLPPVITGEERTVYGDDYSVFSMTEAFHLTEVMRNAGGVLRAAEKVRLTGQIYRTTEKDETGDGGYFFETARRSMERAVSEYVEDRDDHLLITWRNAARMQANRMIRAKLGHDGPLPDEGEPVLIRKNTEHHLNGEVVICRGFREGPVLDTAKKDAVDTYGAKLVTLWMDVVGSPSVLVTVQGAKDGEMFDGGTPWVQDWRRYHAALNREKLPEPVPVTWGYCLTAHAAQGSQARRTTVFLDAGDDRSDHFNRMTKLPTGESVTTKARWFYTAITRSKHMTKVFLGR